MKRCKHYFDWETRNCINCGRSIDELYAIADIKEKFKTFSENQKDIPDEYIDIINKHFWSMI